jgi:hypothetical protein
VDPTATVPTFVKWLERDIATTGRWAGQFGSTANLAEEQQFPLGPVTFSPKTDPG